MTGVRLDTGATLNNQKITNMADGSSPTDAVTKQQLDAIARGLDWKNSVTVATTAAITLSGTQTIDGIAVVAGNRVLVKDQASSPTNGIYVVAAGAWSRATDFDDNTEITASAVVPIELGTVNGAKAFILTGVTGTVTVGTTNLVWTALGGGGITYTAADNSISIVGTTVAVKLKSGGGILLDTNGIYIDPTFSPNRLEADVPAGSASVSIAHTFGVQYLGTSRVYDKSTGQRVMVDEFAIDSTHFGFTFAAAPTAAQYRYCIGK